MDEPASLGSSLVPKIRQVHLEMSTTVVLIHILSPGYRLKDGRLFKVCVVVGWPEQM